MLAHLQLLFQSVGLVGKAPSFRSGNIAGDFKGAEWFFMVSAQRWLLLTF